MTVSFLIDPTRLSASTERIFVPASAERAAELINQMIVGDAPEHTRAAIIRALSNYPERALELTAAARTRIRFVPEEYRYNQVSPALQRLGINVDSWPAPPAGLFVVEERTVYLKSLLPMTIAHEFGHALDCAMGGGTYRSGVDRAIRDEFIKAKSFVTPYAATGLDEAFAEAARSIANVSDHASPWPRVSPERLKRCAPVLYDILLRELGTIRERAPLEQNIDQLMEARTPRSRSLAIEDVSSSHAEQAAASSDRDERRRKLYGALTEQLVELIETGGLPAWDRFWEDQATRGLPRNGTTNIGYRGANVLFLSLTAAKRGYQDPRWMTMRQANEKGWRVRAGEHGTLIEVWKPTIKYVDPKGRQLSPDEARDRLADPARKGEVREKRFGFHRTYLVFNAQQIEVPLERDGGEIERVPLVDVHPYVRPERDWAPNERVEQIVEALGVDVVHANQERAYYSQAQDQIVLPMPTQFQSQSDYCDVKLHEAGHSTGHPSRLNRPMSGTFGTPSYAREELRAELASFFMAAEIGLPHNVQRHAAYLKDWVSVIKSDPMEIYAAARDAQAAQDFMLDKERELLRARERGAERSGGEMLSAKAIVVLQALNRYNVEYALIGGAAVALHGIERAVSDVDLLVSATPGNDARLLAAVADLNGDVEMAREAIEYAVVNAATLDERRSPAAPAPAILPCMPGIELHYRLTGVGWYEALGAQVSTRVGEMSVPIASVEDLIQNKRCLAAPAEKDRRDLAMLEQLQSTPAREVRYSAFAPGNHATSYVLVTDPMAGGMPEGSAALEDLTTVGEMKELLGDGDRASVLASLLLEAMANTGVVALRAPLDRGLEHAVAFAAFDRARELGLSPGELLAQYREPIALRIESIETRRRQGRVEQVVCAVPIDARAERALGRLPVIVYDLTDLDGRGRRTPALALQVGDVMLSRHGDQSFVRAPRGELQSVSRLEDAFNARIVEQYETDQTALTQLRNQRMETLAQRLYILALDNVERIEMPPSFASDVAEIDVDEKFARLERMTDVVRNRQTSIVIDELSAAIGDLYERWEPPNVFGFRSSDGRAVVDEISRLTAQRDVLAVAALAGHDRVLASYVGSPSSERVITTLREQIASQIERGDGSGNKLTVERARAVAYLERTNSLATELPALDEALRFKGINRLHIRTTPETVFRGEFIGQMREAMAAASRQDFRYAFSAFRPDHTPGERRDGVVPDPILPSEPTLWEGDRWYQSFGASIARSAAREYEDISYDARYDGREPRDDDGKYADFNVTEEDRRHWPEIADASTVHVRYDLDGWYRVEALDTEGGILLASYQYDHLPEREQTPRIPGISPLILDSRFGLAVAPAFDLQFVTSRFVTDVYRDAAQGLLEGIRSDSAQYDGRALVEQIASRFAIDDPDLAHGRCGLASEDVAAVLNALGIPARAVGGSIPYDRHAPVAAGVAEYPPIEVTSDGRSLWSPHQWVETPYGIVDVTASQFGQSSSAITIGDRLPSVSYRILDTPYASEHLAVDRYVVDALFTPRAPGAPQSAPAMTAYAVSLTDPTVVIRVEEGLSGYDVVERFGDAQSASRFADERNAASAITPARRNALVAGSLFGFNVPAARDTAAMHLGATTLFAELQEERRSPIFSALVPDDKSPEFERKERAMLDGSESRVMLTAAQEQQLAEFGQVLRTNDNIMSFELAKHHLSYHRGSPTTWEIYVGELGSESYSLSDALSDPDYIKEREQYENVDRPAYNRLMQAIEAIQASGRPFLVERDGETMEAAITRTFMEIDNNRDASIETTRHADARATGFAIAARYRKGDTMKLYGFKSRVQGDLELTDAQAERLEAKGVVKLTDEHAVLSTDVCFQIKMFPAETREQTIAAARQLAAANVDAIVIKSSTQEVTPEEISSGVAAARDQLWEDLNNFPQEARDAIIRIHQLNNEYRSLENNSEYRTLENETLFHRGMEIADELGALSERRDFVLQIGNYIPGSEDLDRALAHQAKQQAPIPFTVGDLIQERRWLIDGALEKIGPNAGEFERAAAAGHQAVMTNLRELSSAGVTTINGATAEKIEAAVALLRRSGPAAVMAAAGVTNSPAFSPLILAEDSRHADARATGAPQARRLEGPQVNHRVILIGEASPKSLTTVPTRNGGELLRVALRQHKGVGDNRTTEFYDMTAFSDLAPKVKAIVEGMQKGELLRVECVVHKDSYEKDGAKHRTTDLYINDVSSISREQAKEQRRNEWIAVGTIKEIGKPNEKGNFVAMTIVCDRPGKDGKVYQDFFKVKALNEEKVKAVQALEVGQTYDVRGRFEREKYEDRQTQVKHADPALLLDSVGPDLGVRQALAITAAEPQKTAAIEAPQVDKDTSPARPSIDVASHDPVAAAEKVLNERVIDREALEKDGVNFVERGKLSHVAMSGMISGQSADGQKLYMELGRGDKLEFDVASFGANVPEIGSTYSVKQQENGLEVATKIEPAKEVDRSKEQSNELGVS